MCVYVDIWMHRERDTYLSIIYLSNITSREITLPSWTVDFNSKEHRCYSFSCMITYEVKCLHMQHLWFSFIHEKWKSESHSVLFDSLGHHGLYSPPGCSVHDILQARILEWAANPLFRGSSWTRDQTQVSYITGRFFTNWATREVFFFLINLFISIGSYCFTILWWFLAYIDMNQPWVYMCPPLWTPLPPPSPPHPSELSQCTGFECPISFIELGLVIYFTYGNTHISMLFSQIIPPLPSPTESKCLLFISVSLLPSSI